MKTPKGIAKRKSRGRQIKLAEPASFSPVRYAILTRNPKIVPSGDYHCLCRPLCKIVIAKVWAWFLLSPLFCNQERGQ